MRKTPIIIDTDPGVDDALALITMLRDKKFDIKFISSVAGNVNIEHTTQNILYLISNYNPDIPVGKGAKQPLLKKFEDASDVHGEGGFGRFIVPTTDVPLTYEDAQMGYREVLENATKPVTVLTLGPLTNIATLIQTQPELLPKIKKVYSMIASYDGTGNVRPYAEYNAFCDPDALQIVLNAGLDLTILPMQLGHVTKILKEEFAKVKVTQPAINMIKQMVLGTVETAVPNEYFALYDLHVPTSVEYPYFYKFVKADISVCTDPNGNYGQTFITPNKSGKFKVAYVRNHKKIENRIFKELYKGFK